MDSQVCFLVFGLNLLFYFLFGVFLLLSFYIRTFFCRFPYFLSETY
jgi:hypothetical protein